jgi:hypothetical protein
MKIMNKKSNSFKNIISVLMALLLLGIAAGPASAAITSVPSLSDGNDGVYFYGENITITWQADGPTSYLRINSTGSVFNGTDDGNNMYDNKNSVSLLATQVLGTGVSSPFSFTYTFANNTVNQSAQAWYLYLNTSNSDMINSASKTAFMMMSYNVSLKTGRSAAEGYSTLAGDTIQVNLNTSGLGANSTRDGRAFTITLPEGYNTVSAATNVANTGNYTFNITTTTSGVGVLRNITLNYGGFSWNSTKLATYLGSVGTTNTQFNVSQVNLRAYSIGEGTSSKNITSVNITSKDLSGTMIPANMSYTVNITLTNSITTASTISFNTTTPGFVNNYTVNVTFHVGEGTIGNTDGNFWGNYANPINTTNSISVTATTPGTITATTNTSGQTWTSSYNIYNSDALISIASPTASQAFVVGANITITGWSANSSAPVSINITDTGVFNKTNPTVSGTKEIWNTSVTPDATDGTFTATWVTNESWNSTNNYNVFYAPSTGSFVITANSTNSTVGSITKSITFSQTLAVTTNRTSNVVSIDSPILLNITTNRLNNNGTTYWYNITSGSTVINNTLSNVTLNFNSTTNTSSGNALWTPVDNVVQLASLGVSTNTANISTTLTVKDNATTTTATVYVTDYVTVNNVVGVAGNTVNITGTTGRANGSNAINISIYEMIGGVRGNWKLENIALATVNNNAWYNSSVYLTSTGAVGGTALSAGTYQIEVNDTIVKALGTLTIGTAAITVDPQLTPYSYDGTAYITGSTNLPTGTNLTVNITTAAGAIVNNTIYAIVNATQYFNATWPINQSAALRGNFTKPSTVYTINATNGTYYGLGNITLSSDITVSPSRTSVVTGDGFNISGTSGRIAGKTVLINVTAGNFNAGTTATVSSSGTFEITINATDTLATGGVNLVNGAYTITVNDSTGLLITNTSTFNVVNPSLVLVSPVSGTVYANGSNISISGTSNRGSGVSISLTITGVNYALSGVTATTDANGNFTYYWNTTSAIVGTPAAPGTYSVTAVSGSVASNTLSIVLAVQGLTSITVSPSSANLTIGQTQTFVATGFDQSGNPTTISPEVVWSSSTSAGTINATTGVFTANNAGTSVITAQNGTNGTVSGTATVTVSTAAPALVSAITPNSRNAQLGTPVTLFMSVINYGTATATGVSITQASGLAATVGYQKWNGTSFIGSADTPVDMAAGETANFVLTINATSAFDSSSMTFNVSGTNVAAAPISAVNTLTISANATASADVIMISTTLDVSTPVNTPTAFAIATMNVGGASATDVSLVVNVPSGITGLAYQVNQTNPTTGEIIGPATGLTIAVGAQPTFAVFLNPTVAIANDPTNNRITLRLVDGTGKVIGAQSVAVRTT